MTEKQEMHKIVFVQPQIVPPTTITVKVAILLDKNPRQVAAFLRRKGNENVTAWPFYIISQSNPVENISNWKRSRHGRVIRPFVHIKQNEIGTIVEQLLEQMQFVQFEIVYDESGCF